jgi:4-hydroxy-tetrahydrodipicolinate reductase
MTISGGVAGDVATAAIVVNAIPKLIAARPGLVTMTDIPLVHRFNPAEARDLPTKKR